MSFSYKLHTNSMDHNINLIQYLKPKFLFFIRTKLSIFHLNYTLNPLWSGVSAAQTSGVCERDQHCPKTRELVTTVWGGDVTLFVLSFDFWGAVKAYMGDSASTSNKVVKWITFFTRFILNPFFCFVSSLGMRCGLIT